MTDETSGAKPPSRRPTRARAAMREQVDAIFSQWQAERPDIDPGPVHIFGLIGRIQMQCTALIDEALLPFDLTRGTYDVLTALRRAGTPYSLSPKQIAQSLLLSGAGLTSRLNKLEAQNYLARLPEPNDRRTLRVQLTSAGEAIINEAIPRVFDVQRSLLSPLGLEGQQRLVGELARFADVIDGRHSAKTGATDPAGNDL